MGQTKRIQKLPEREGDDKAHQTEQEEVGKQKKKGTNRGNDPKKTRTGKQTSLWKSRQKNDHHRNNLHEEEEQQ